MLKKGASPFFIVINSLNWRHKLLILNAKIMKLNSLGSLLSLVSLVFVGASFGQTTKVLKSEVTPPSIVYKSEVGPNGQIRCHTMEADSIRRANDPTLPSLWEEELWLQKKIAEYKQQQEESKQQQTVLTIPIIFHIFTSGSGNTNVPASRIQAQVDQLNIDYANLAGSNYAVAANTNVQFCLALVDESGNTLAEPGINRITSYGAGPFTDTQFDNTMKAATIWDPTQYFNVWVANLSGGLLGYAQFPSNSGLGGMPTNGGSANTDGVVILYTSVGSVANPNPLGGQYGMGRTLTHEAGHWLGLRHIWGDGGCSVDDFCNDTPKSDASNFGCPNTNSCTDSYGAPWPTANPADMVENYMDYTDDDCMHTFTGDQAIRIQTVMSVSPRRNTLNAASATKCNVVTVADDAGINGISDPSGSICATGTTITPTVTLSNNGTNTLTSVTINYNLDGGTNQTYSWTGSLAPGATVNVTLPTMTTTAGTHTFNASTSNPNGNADGNTANDADVSSFNLIIGGQAVSLTIDTDCYGEETVWELFDASSNLVASGGNSTVTTPVTATQGTASSDAGAYAAETTIVETLCLVDGCYDLIVWDAYGDGMYGSQYSGCNTDGYYEVTDGGGAVLASLQAANADFGFSETSNFCLTSCSSTVTATQTATETCNGDNTNTVTVAITGNSTGATYDIGSGATTNNVFNNLAQGTYNITVVDGDACTTVVPVTISGPAQLSVSAVGTNISCNGQTDGQIVLSANGGTPGYTYSVNGNSTTNTTVTGLSAGSYTIAITDNNGCTASTSSVSISEPTVLTSSVGTITPELGGNDGSVNLSVSGGTAPYSYAWTGPNGYTSGVQDPNNMPGGTYNVTITDANGCTSVQTGIVVPSQLGIDENGNMIFSIYPNPSNGIFNVAISNPADEATIQVMDIAGRIIYVNDHVNGQVSVDLSSFANGNYMIAIDLNGATHVKRITLKK